MPKHCTSLYYESGTTETIILSIMLKAKDCWASTVRCHTQFHPFGGQLCRLLTVTFVVFSHAALRSVWTQSNQSATLIWYQHLCSLWASQDSLLQCSPTQSSSGWVKETLFISRWRGEVQNTHHRPLKKNQATLCLLMHQLAHKCSGSIAAFFLSLLPLISSKLR